MRPLGFGEIFDVAIKIFWKNAGTLLAVVAVVIVPMQIISNLIIVSTLPDPDLLGGSVFQPATPTQPTGLVDGDDVALMFAGVAVAALFSLIATALATGASYKAVGDAYLGEKPNWKTSLSYGWRRTHSLVWINLLTLFAIGGIFFAFIFVGGFMGGITGETAVIVITFLLAFLGAAAAAAWIWVSWSVATPALLTEDARGTKALRRSFQLVRGRWWRTFGLLILGYLIVLVVSGIISTIPQIVLLTDVGDSTVASLVIGGVGSALASILTTPFLAALVTVVYFDLRVNKEGFDLQLLAQRIGVTPPTELPAGLQPPAPPGWPPPASPGQPGWGPPPPGPSAPGWGPPPQQWAPPPQGPPRPGWGYPAPGPPAPGWQPPPPSPEPGPPEQPPPPDEK